MTVLCQSTLTEALQSAASGRKSITYISGPSEERAVSYRSLDERARGVLYHLQAKGLMPGAELIIHLDHNEQFVDAFWACILGGITAVPLAAGVATAHREKFFRVFATLKNPYIYTDSANLERLGAFARDQGISTLPPGRIQLVDDIEDVARQGIPVEVRPDHIAFVQFSSGSTGEPKGVVLSHRNIMANIRAIALGCALDSGDSGLSWMPLTHDMGLVGFHLTPLAFDIDQYLMPTELFVRRPLFWLEKACEKRATILAAPNFGFKHFLKRFDPKIVSQSGLSHVRLIFNGAEPISAEECRKFSRVLAPHGLSPTAVFPVYGLAEATLAVTFAPRGAPVSSVHAVRDRLRIGSAVELRSEADAHTRELVHVGAAVNGIEVRIADGEDRPLGPDRLGHILIRGESVTAGYYGADGLDRSAFKPGGWLDTGDLGFFNQEQLVIAGRSKEVVIINGQNFHPPDLEAICAKVAGIESGKVAVCGASDESEADDRLLVFAIHRGSVETFLPVALAVKHNLAVCTGLTVHYVLPLASLPKTSSGKLQRVALAARFRRGEFDGLVAEIDRLEAERQHCAAHNGLEGILLGICQSVISDQEIGVDDNIFDMGTSSLKLAQIHEKIDQRFPDLLDITDFFEYPTVSQLAQFLEAKHAV